MPKKPQARDPLSLACEHVGRFLYHFARVEMQLDAAITTIFVLDPRYAPIITGSIDFARKVSIVERAVTLHNESRSKKIKMDTFSKVFEVNGHRLIIAHCGFEPDGAAAVQFRRSKAHGESDPPGLHWTKQQFEQRCQKLERLEAKLSKIVSEIQGEQFLPEDLSPWAWASPLPPEKNVPGLLQALLGLRPLEALANAAPFAPLAHPPPTPKKRTRKKK